MTLAQMICDAGYTNLAQYLCNPLTGGGTTVIGGDVVAIAPTLPIQLDTVNTEEISVAETKSIGVEEHGIIIQITELQEDDIDGI